MPEPASGWAGRVSDGEPPLATTLRAVAEILGEYDVDSAIRERLALRPAPDRAPRTEGNDNR